MITNNTSTVSYNTNGLTKVFTIPFPFFLSTDIEVTLDGNLITTGITIQGGNNSTGTLTFVNAPTTGQVLLIRRVMDFTQPFRFNENPYLSSKDVEDAYDRIAMLVQQIQRDVATERALKVPEGESIGTIPSAPDRAGKYLAFNATGEPFADSSINIGTAKGAWTTATAYSAGDLVYDPANSRNLYYVLNGYTSSVSVALDIDNGNLQLLVVAPEATGIKNNYAAITDPTNADNNLDNYEIGSEWVNTNNDNVFKLTSLDSIQSAADNDWYSVAYGNGVYVAVAQTGTGNRVMTSPDGLNWTIQTSAEDSAWYSVTYGNGLFVAVASSGTNRIMTSPDGVTWTAVAAPSTRTWVSVTYGNGLFVAVSLSTTDPGVMTSPDGVTWTTRNTPAFEWFSVTYGDGLFVAVSLRLSGPRVMTSPDGITWTTRTTPADATDNQYVGVTYGNGLFVAVAYLGSADRVMTSPDGITWTLRDTPVQEQFVSISYGNGVYVAVAQTGNKAIYSYDGITWTATTVLPRSWRGVIFGDNLFVAVARTGTGDRVMVSPDGVDWTSTKKAIWTQLSGSGTGSGVPTGTLAWWPASTVPSGYLACNGSAVLKATYPDLYGILKDGGAECIYGEDATTFNLPDARERYLRMSGATNSVADTLEDANKSHSHNASAASSGSHSHSGSTNTTGSHSHTSTSLKYIYYGNIGSGSGIQMYVPAGFGGIPEDDASSSFLNAGSAGNHSHSLSIESAGAHTHNITVDSDGETEARPKTIVFQLCIKT